MSLTFNPETLAGGWLPVAVAASDDKGRPALFKTLSIEQYHDGIRLTSTDSYMLLTAWVPTVAAEADLSPEPTLDEAPDRVAVVVDHDGRGRGLITYAAQLASKDVPIDITLTLDGSVQYEVESGPETFEGMAPRHATLQVPGMEMVRLNTYEGEFPDWRKIDSAFEAQPTPTVALAPSIVARLVKAAKVQDRKIGWTFGGETAAARVDLIDSDPFVTGYAMPCRWDLEQNAPYVEPTPDDEDDEGEVAS